MENERTDAVIDATHAKGKVAYTHSGKGRPNPSREAKISDANWGRENIISSGWVTTSRIGNYTRLIYTLLKVLNIHTYSHLR